MNTRPAYQFDYAGMLVGETVADESPLEPGVFLLPGQCTFVPPPTEISEHLWPRWWRNEWELVARPVAAEQEEVSPIARLQAFLAANPDVAMLLTAEGALPQSSAANDAN